MDTYALERSWKPCSRSSFSGSCPAATSFLSTKHQNTSIMKKYSMMIACNITYIMCAILTCILITNFYIWNLWVSTHLNFQNFFIFFSMYCTVVIFQKLFIVMRQLESWKNLYFYQHKVMPYNQATHYRTCTCNFSKKRCWISETLIKMSVSPE